MVRRCVDDTTGHLLLAAVFGALFWSLIRRAWKTPLEVRVARLELALGEAQVLLRSARQGTAALRGGLFGGRDDRGTVGAAHRRCEAGAFERVAPRAEFGHDCGQALRDRLDASFERTNSIREACVPGGSDPDRGNQSA